MARPIPGLMEQAHAAGLQATFFYGWEPLRNLSLPDKLTLSYCCNLSETDLESDPRLIDETIRFIAKNPQLDFAFVYLGTLDTAGHKYGWMSDGYLAQLEQIDGALGKLLEALPDDATVLVQSDHGGHERSHGTNSPEDMTIPWLISGPEIRPGYEISSSVSLLDTAPTLARLLNISPHPAWEGRCIEEVFIKHQ
jgi:phosphopentomutase